MPTCSAPELGPAEVPRLATHGNRVQRTLEVIGVQGDIGLAQKHLQPRTALAHVFQRLGKDGARLQSVLLELAVNPFEKRLDAWL